MAKQTSDARKVTFGKRKCGSAKKAITSTHQNPSNTVDKDAKIIQVLGITQKMSGCGWHRVMLPLAFLPDSFNHVCNVPTKEILETITVLR